MKEYLYKPVFATALVAALLLTSSVTGITATQSGNPEILFDKSRQWQLPYGSVG